MKDFKNRKRVETKTGGLTLNDPYPITLTWGTEGKFGNMWKGYVKMTDEDLKDHPILKSKKFMVFDMNGFIVDSDSIYTITGGNQQKTHFVDANYIVNGRFSTFYVEKKRSKDGVTDQTEIGQYNEISTAIKDQSFGGGLTRFIPIFLKTATIRWNIDNKLTAPEKVKFDTSVGLYMKGFADRDGWKISCQELDATDAYIDQNMVDYAFKVDPKKSFEKPLDNGGKRYYPHFEFKKIKTSATIVEPEFNKFWEWMDDHIAQYAKRVEEKDLENVYIPPENLQSPDDIGPSDTNDVDHDMGKTEKMIAAKKALAQAEESARKSTEMVAGAEDTDEFGEDDFFN